MGEVRHADEHHTAGHQPRAHLFEQAGRVDGVLEHVGGDDQVEPRANLGRQALVEVGLDERVEAVPDVDVLHHVDADDAMPRVAEECPEPAVGTSDVEHRRPPDVRGPRRGADRATRAETA